MGEMPRDRGLLPKESLTKDSTDSHLGQTFEIDESLTRSILPRGRAASPPHDCSASSRSFSSRSKIPALVTASKHAGNRGTSHGETCLGRDRLRGVVDHIASGWSISIAAVLRGL